MDADYFENDYARLWIANQILFFEYKENVVLDLEAAQKVVLDRLMIQNEKEYPVLCDVRGIIDSDKAGRDYLAQSGSIMSKAVALLVHPNTSQVMSKFYLEVSKPRVSTRVFTDKNEAVNFLQYFI
ncbi:hypothetical protein FLJC2902T_13490 [Flavobacterium limnosediminis JC2902]|uniref:DUF7793 domain-containing protein n=1 Tax=Flavobacterium limnosediminis JC2902 TaxID=1341181 RepID=V6SQN1_9FLAO|nr:hypothetical protein [Flavobacterium limnosediminis]ESU28754.1 hypothetical protein FLJC2902T_13490 [Flavobacterium limnosediminis JC2902]